MSIERITYKNEWLDNVIQKGKLILEELAKETFHRYREMGHLILTSGYKKGEWHSEHRQRACEQWNISRRTFSNMVQLAELSEHEFGNAIAKFSSVYAWANQGKEGRNHAPFEFELYNIWKTFKLDLGFGEDYPGRTPHQIIANLLYYYTSEGDLILDPMAGGGTTIDVCKAMNREWLAYDLKPGRKDIQSNDVLNWIPAKNVDFVFLDPPYYKQNPGYEESAFTSSLSSFYEAMEKALTNCYTVLKDNGKLALLIKPMGLHETGEFEWADLSFECCKIAEKTGLKLIKRICAPLSTQQYNALDVHRAKEHRYMLNTLRDVLVFQK